MHLTWRTYAWVTLIVVSGIMAQWVGGPLVDGWRILSATLLILLIIEGYWISLRPLVLTREAPAQAYLGRPMRASLKLVNLRNERLRMSAVQPLPRELAGGHTLLDFDLAAQGEVIRDYTAVPIELGAHAWSPIYTRTRGYFGLAWWDRLVTLPEIIDVVPDAMSASERRAASTASGDVTARSSGQGLELLGLREYIPGDPLRSFDWKATARTGRPYVRVFAQEQRLEILLMVDCSRRSTLRAGALDRLSHYINIAARLAECAQQNRDPVGLLTFADGVIEHHRPAVGIAALVRLRAALTRLSPSQAEPALLKAMLTARRLLGNRALVVLFTDLDVEERAGQWIRALQLLAPKHFPLIACLQDADLEAKRRAEARSWRDPFDILAAAEIEHAAATNRVLARRLGAQVVAAQPDELDRAVIAAYRELRLRRRV